MKLLFATTLLLGCLAVFPNSLLAQEGDATTQDERFAKFSELLTGSKFVGNFTVVGQDNSNLTPEEYHIKSVKKSDRGNEWVFTARIKYQGHDVSLPISLDVEWAGDTPIITVTDWTMFGIGPFSSRVVIYNGKYAGTWSHGDVGGHMFGEIRPDEAEGVDVEKSKMEMEKKMKEAKEKQESSEKAEGSSGSKDGR